MERDPLFSTIDVALSGTKVVSKIDKSLTGTIVGYTVIQSTLKYVVALDKGDYLRSKDVFISIIVADPSSLEEAY